MQESGREDYKRERGGGRSDTEKALSVVTNKEEARDHHGARPGKGGKNRGQQEIWEAKPRECGAIRVAARPPEWPMSPPARRKEMEGGHKRN